MCACIVLGGEGFFSYFVTTSLEAGKDILCRSILTSLPRETDLLLRVSCVLHMCNTVLG